MPLAALGLWCLRSGSHQHFLRQRISKPVRLACLSRPTKARPVRPNIRIGPFPVSLERRLVLALIGPTSSGQARPVCRRFGVIERKQTRIAEMRSRSAQPRLML